MSLSDLDSVRSYLATDIGNGTSLHGHLRELLLHIMQNKPQDALKNFESFSVLLKEKRLKEEEKKKEEAEAKPSSESDSSAAPSSGSAAALASAQELSKLAARLSLSSPDAPTPITHDSKLKTDLIAFLDKTRDLIKKPKQFDEDGEEIVEEEEIPAHIPDLTEQARLLQAAGVRLEEDELYYLQQSLTELCQKTEQIETCKFWGKVFGTKKDYYIVEAKLSEYEDEEEEETEDGKPSKKEPNGTGANEYVYYVSNSPLGPFTRLPSVRPEQIIAARGMRRFFTGDLTAPVFGLPRFEGGEAAYLRTQIARISAACWLTVSGAQVRDEDDRTIAVENEDFRGVRSSLLASTNSAGKHWLHARNKLLEEGRIEPFVDEDAPEEKDEEDMTELELEEKKRKEKAKEKVLPILTPTAEDVLYLKHKHVLADGSVERLVARRRKCWAYKLNQGHDNGVKATARVPGEEVDEEAEEEERKWGPASHSIATAHSLLWPGAVNVAQNKSIVNFYVGFGTKQINQLFSPPALPAFESEYVYTPSAAVVEAVAAAQAAGEAQATHPLLDIFKEQTDPAPPAERPQEELDEEAENEKRKRKERGEEEEEEEEDVDDGADGEDGEDRGDEDDE